MSTLETLKDIELLAKMTATQDIILKLLRANCEDKAIKIVEDYLAELKVEHEKITELQEKE